jgi:hypothetical protein
MVTISLRGVMMIDPGNENDGTAHVHAVARQPDGTPTLLYCATGFFVITIASLALLVGVLMWVIITARTLDYGTARLIVGIAILAAAAGFVLARAYRNSLSAKSESVLSAEAKALLGPSLEKSSDPIGDWTRLSGLVGGTGVFRKLEVSGMPLATILMTILFCLLSAVVDPFLRAMDILNSTADLSKGFMDMAKLTLGAFIGSFVTKGSAREAEATKIGAAAAVKAVTEKMSSANAEADAARSARELAAPVKTAPSDVIG